MSTEEREKRAVEEAPDVEGHKMRLRGEETGGLEKRAHPDDDPDVEGHMIRHRGGDGTGAQADEKSRNAL